VRSAFQTCLIKCRSLDRVEELKEFNLANNHNVIKLYFTANKSTMYTSYNDEVWAAMIEFSPVCIIRHFFPIPLRWRIRQIVLHFFCVLHWFLVHSSKLRSPETRWCSPTLKNITWYAITERLRTTGLELVNSSSVKCSLQLWSNSDGLQYQTWASAEIFPARGGQNRHIAYPFQVADDATHSSSFEQVLSIAGGRIQNALTFLRHEENVQCYGNSCKQCSA